MNDLRHRLRNKLMIQQAIKRAIKVPTKEELDNMIAEQLTEAALKAKKEEMHNEDLFIWHDGRELPVQSLLLDVLYDFIKKDPNIMAMTIETRDGKTLRLTMN